MLKIKHVETIMSNQLKNKIIWTTFVHPSYIEDIAPIYDSSPWRCAYAAEVLRVPMSITVPDYLVTEIFVWDVK